MKIRTNVRAGINVSPRCAPADAAARCGGTPRCGGSTTYIL